MSASGRLRAVLFSLPLVLLSLQLHAQRCGPTSSRLAILKWYGNSTCGSISLGDEGSSWYPQGILFDGKSIWIGTGNYGDILKMEPSTGVIEARYSVGATPATLAFDGTDIWIANFTAPGTVKRLRPSDGAILESITVADWPEGIVFDGTSIWVSSCGPTGSTGVLTRIPVLDEGAHPNMKVYSNVVDGCPDAMAFDGTNLWVSSYYGAKVTKVHLDDNGGLTVVATIPVPSNASGLAFDGEHVWVANGDYAGTFGFLTKIDGVTGQKLHDYPIDPNPRGVLFDGNSVWVTSWHGLGDPGGRMWRFRAGTGELVGKYETGYAPRGVAFDGTYVWVTNNGTSTLSKF